jgi:hypothetical protein
VLGHDLDPIVTMDDPTNWIYSAILVDEEGTMSSFLGLRETIAAHGLFGSLHTDRGSHYFVTPKAGGKTDKGHLTQVGRAPAEPGSAFAAHAVASLDDVLYIGRDNCVSWSGRSQQIPAQQHPLHQGDGAGA